MQKREFKDAMKEMSAHVANRIKYYSDEIVFNYKTQEGKVLDGTDLNGARAVLYVILNKLLEDFEPKNNTYEKIEKDLCDFFDISYDRREYEEEELG
jgi:hypothetical protein|tara:strand:+ start:462 stop:752 length:291 start_codon:yes stop_codon:yes gene_type:complete